MGLDELDKMKEKRFLVDKRVLWGVLVVVLVGLIILNNDKVRSWELGGVETNIELIMDDLEENNKQFNKGIMGITGNVITETNSKAILLRISIGPVLPSNGLGGVTLILPSSYLIVIRPFSI